MNRAALITQITSMIQENPVEVTSGSETHDGGVANMTTSEKQANVGELKSYSRSVWIIIDEWTTLPAKRGLITIESETYRILMVKDYYMNTARRLDLGAQYENGGD